MLSRDLARDFKTYKTVGGSDIFEKLKDILKQSETEISKSRTMEIKRMEEEGLCLRMTYLCYLLLNMFISCM